MLENSLVVVGGGHAGIEAAFAAARLGCRVKLVCSDPLAIGRLSCNPAVGGLAKTHLVKEIDALGGIIGFAADACALQYKTLNKTKGRAVWSVRAQVDKKKYPLFVQNLIKKNPLIDIVVGEASSLFVENNTIKGVFLSNKTKIRCSAVVVACGTFVDGFIHVGQTSYAAGRFGEKNVVDISKSLLSAGHSFIRLKTGTPPRISLKSVNLEKTTLASGDKNYFPFSLSTKKTISKQEDCFLVNTNEEVHNIINKDLKKSAMFSGKIKGVGPRYCPSVEDKVFRFKERTSHHLFLEPEWSCSDQIYINGFSTSLPKETQERALKKIEALKNVKFIRPGYAIEYNVVPPRELKSTLESKIVSGLFLCGQINGTSGYEEAAAQGLIAGINAAKLNKKELPFILSRQESYIGVLIDDLVTNHLDEPYRMFTSRAEHRLFLRPDNCYTRLYKKSIKNNILSPSKSKEIKDYLKELERVFSFVSSQKTEIDNKKLSIKEALKRPEITFWKIKESSLFKTKKQTKLAVFEAETTIKYEGYIQNEKERIEKNSLLDSLKIPSSFNFNKISGLSNESKERLCAVKPETLGQASRIFGIRPTDITLIGFHLQRSVSRETS